MEHASWCAKTARPADPKLRGYEVGAGGTTSWRKVEEAACTCSANPTARLLRRLKSRARQPETGS